jgi:RNA polymerase sigma-70 factor, ECF subfamily
MSGEGNLPSGLMPWIEAARGGSPEGLGRALEACRDYLLLVANRALDADLRAKGGASDLVQETFLEAQRAFGRFEGRTERELLAWLRQILRHRLAHFARRYRETEGRRAAREVSLESGAPCGDLAADTTSPCSRAIRREQERALVGALDRLPEHYRRAVLWRHREGLDFEEIGRRLDCSADAARKVWARAIERLRREMMGRRAGAGASS